MDNNHRAAESKAAFSFDEFCRRNSISRRTLYNMLEDGIGPRTMKLRGRRLISAAAEADWIREREVATDAA